MDRLDITSAASDEAEFLEDDLAGQATHWVVRLTSGESTPEERLAFERWRRESPAHAAALAEARRLWLTIGPALEPAQRRERTAYRLGRRGKIGALAASLLLSLLAGGEYVHTYWHDQVTRPGEIRTLTLADGTRVVMSGRSALDLGHKDAARKVVLAYGEAYFEVIHDPAQPFSVVAGSGEVRDIGTAFSVRRENGGAVVVVARGEVEMEPLVSGGRSARILPNEAIAYDSNGIGTVKVIDAAEALSWTRGKLILENSSLPEAIDEINRYYNGHVLLLDNAANSRRINAVIDVDRIDDWLAALNETHAAKVARVGSFVLLY